MRLRRNNYSCFRIAVPVACARPLMRNDRRRPSRTRARNTVIERGVVIDPAANTGFRCGTTPYPRRRHEIFDTERWPLTAAEDHAKDSIESLAAILRRNAPSQSLARVLRRSTRLKSNRKSQQKHSAKEVGRKCHNGASLQIIEPELAENATMGPAMTEFRALMQEQ